MIYLELFIPVIPVAKGRPRFFRRGKFVGTYTPDATREYEAQIEKNVLWHMNQNSIYLELGPLSVEIVFYFPRPKSQTKKQLACVHHAKRPDTDNLVKGVFDAINGVVFKDDAQVCLLSAAKRYCQVTQQPGVLLRVEKLEG